MMQDRNKRPALGDITNRLKDSCSAKVYSKSAKDIEYPIPGASKLVLTGTGFFGEDRNKIRELASALGAQYSGNLVAGTTTHLVCASPMGARSSAKYDVATKQRIPVVTVSWVIDSLKRRQLLPEHHYLVADNVSRQSHSMVCSNGLAAFGSVLDVPESNLSPGKQSCIAESNEPDSACRSVQPRPVAAHQPLRKPEIKEDPAMSGATAKPAPGRVVDPELATGKATLKGMHEINCCKVTGERETQVEQPERVKPQSKKPSRSKRALGPSSSATSKQPRVCKTAGRTARDSREQSSAKPRAVKRLSKQTAPRSSAQRATKSVHFGCEENLESPVVGRARSDRSQLVQSVQIQKHAARIAQSPAAGEASGPAFRARRTPAKRPPAMETGNEDKAGGDGERRLRPKAELKQRPPRSSAALHHQVPAAALRFYESVDVTLDNGERVSFAAGDPCHGAMLYYEDDPQTRAIVLVYAEIVHIYELPSGELWIEHRYLFDTDDLETASKGQLYLSTHSVQPDELVRSIQVLHSPAELIEDEFWVFPSRPALERVAEEYKAQGRLALVCERAWDPVTGQEAPMPKSR